VGLTNIHQFSDKLKNSSSLYGSLNTIKNPTVQNYERKREPHFGGRTLFTYDLQSGPSIFQFAAGGEYQQGFFKYRTYRNISGRPDRVRIIDELDIRQVYVFGQLNWRYRKLVATFGSSLNRVNLDFHRSSAHPAVEAAKTFQA